LYELNETIPTSGDFYLIEKWEGDNCLIANSFCCFAAQLGGLHKNKEETTAVSISTAILERRKLIVQEGDWKISDGSDFKIFPVLASVRFLLVKNNQDFLRLENRNSRDFIQVKHKLKYGGEEDMASLPSPLIVTNDEKSFLADIVEKGAINWKQPLASKVFNEKEISHLKEKNFTTLVERMCVVLRNSPPQVEEKLQYCLPGGRPDHTGKDGKLLPAYEQAAKELKEELEYKVMKQNLVSAHFVNSPVDIKQRSALFVCPINYNPKINKRGGGEFVNCEAVRLTIENLKSLVDIDIPDHICKNIIDEQEKQKNDKKIKQQKVRQQQQKAQQKKTSDKKSKYFRCFGRR